ncbi:hypothetical protein Hanom_Chr03g00209641 [Helianthus anomalus]
MHKISLYNEKKMATSSHLAKCKVRHTLITQKDDKYLEHLNKPKRKFNQPISTEKSFCNNYW